MAVLPLVGRLRLDATCLVIGSLAPDFEYFVRVRQASTISHTWLGLFAFDLPATLILAFVFHHAIKWPLVLVTPRAIARRAAGLAARPWGTWSLGFVASLVISSLLGALTHILWDGITHSDGYIVPHVSWLRTPIEVPVLDRVMVLHRLLQHASTVIGLVVCAIFVVRALRRAQPVELPPRPRWWPRLVAFTLIAGGAAATAPRAFLRKDADDIGNVVVVLLAGALAGALLASVVLRRAALHSRP